ncbi:MAG: YkgJ family cysteine cluster protein [Nitrospinae bacterium]|nr:YkgJ family cysteine cluster protein [Nitrospinota bacterium]
MSDDTERALADYAAFVAEADARMGALTARHGGAITCHAGCDDCCRVERSALPIEAEIVRRALADLPLPTIERLRAIPLSPDRCALLLDGLCAVYRARPLICRTHGAPLLVDTGEEMGVSICELNMAGFSDMPDFLDDDLFDTVAANGGLSALNDRFVAASGCSPDRAPLGRLLRD